MDVIASLPEDAQLMIFSRVGNVKDLFRFAMTCRWWAHRFTDLAFLCRLFRYQKARFEFCQTMMNLRTTESTSVSAPTLMLSPWSPLTGPTERSLTAFVRDHDGTFNYAKPLDARHGIILMQLVPRSFDRPKPSVLLSLSNPITGERHLLPPLETPHGYPDIGLQVTLSAIITAADSTNLVGGQLLLITTKGFGPGNEVYLHSYSVDTRNWSTPTRWLEANRYSLVCDSNRAAVVHRGAAHWLCTDCRITKGLHQDNDENLYKLSVEVGTARVSMTKLPFHAGGTRLLHVSKEGKLSVTCIHVMHVTLWTQQECGEEGNDAVAPWLSTIIRVTLDPKFLPRLRPCATWLQWFCLNDGSLLVLKKELPGYSISILDLEKKVMEEVKHRFLRETDINDVGDLAFVPYEVDLVKFFVLRLGRISVKTEEPHHL